MQELPPQHMTEEAQAHALVQTEDLLSSQANWKHLIKDRFPTVSVTHPCIIILSLKGLHTFSGISPFPNGSPRRENMYGGCVYIYMYMHRHIHLHIPQSPLSLSIHNKDNHPTPLHLVPSLKKPLPYFVAVLLYIMKKHPG